MENEVALRFSLVALAGLMVVVAVCTFSFKKVLVTYAYGIIGISGVLLPDWEFFDRDFSQWFTPMAAPRGSAANRLPTIRFKLYPMRVALLSTIYCFGIYKWWMYVLS
ncbi:hypothetical protein HPP92_005842 [Vanilla planifolia]|uniref:Signal peptidase complex-like protein DTM1 n=1 Tax=Vanilla planifolia TaxID=51239 RepID=A0A835V9F8_VANPL|nr:hypothetical protein HPP92_005842 [Vanilla planifolia]